MTVVFVAFDHRDGAAVRDPFEDRCRLGASRIPTATIAPVVPLGQDLREVDRVGAARVKMSVPRVGVSVKVSASVAVRLRPRFFATDSANVTLSVIARLMDRPLAIDSAKWIASVTCRAVSSATRATTLANVTLSATALTRRRAG
jgi:hypothetical protein